MHGHHVTVATHGVNASLLNKQATLHAPVPDSLRMTMELVVAPPAKYLHSMRPVTHESIQDMFCRMHEQPHMARILHLKLPTDRNVSGWVG